MRPINNRYRSQTLKGYAQKKITRYKEQDAQKVAEYLLSIGNFPKSRIAYVDETGIDTYLFRAHCYAKRGEKIVGYVSGRKYRRIGLVAAQMGHQILAPLQYDGTMGSALFEHWFESRLMRELPENSVIVMDNAAFHRKQALAALAQKHGHRLIFLPPYSPELNPIEHLWARIKIRLKSILANFDNFDDALHYCFKTF